MAQLGGGRRVVEADLHWPGRGGGDGQQEIVLVHAPRADENDLLLTITAATPRPVQISFDHAPPAAELRHAIDEAIPADFYFDDVHGSPAYRRRLTYYYAEQIRAELGTQGAAA
jgi:hypothetical protein